MTIVSSIPREICKGFAKKCTNRNNDQNRHHDSIIYQHRKADKSRMANTRQQSSNV